MSNYNSHAGHGVQGSKSCGATGIVNESEINRLINIEFIDIMRKECHAVHDCTNNYPTSKDDNLKKIVTACNSHSVDLDISHHLNSGRNDYPGDGSIGGVEIWVSSKTSKAYIVAERICKKLEGLGFRNRGVKIQPNYYVIKNTKAPAMIIEYFFVDDKDDCNLYSKLGYKAIAKAVAEGILNKSINTNISTSTGYLSKGSYSGRKATVNTDVLNVRYNRGTSYEVIGKLKKGQTVSLEWCEDNGWVSIQGFKGHKGLGYVSSKYLELI